MQVSNQPPYKTMLTRTATRAAETTLPRVHSALSRSPRLNDAVGNLTGPMVKRMFNKPSAPGENGPPPLTARTIEEARRIMADRFRPEEGRVLIGIAGGGKETVHAFVVSGVEPDGSVTITQALAQTAGKPEDYSGVGGKLSQMLDKALGNKPEQMQGVLTESWSSYAVRSKRNSVVILELQADPKEVAKALAELEALVGKPYDKAMLGADPATPATQAGMYCTEISSWFVNRLRPGTIRPSRVMGFPIFQVADHMRATTVHGGPLKVLFNGQNRLDIAAVDPFPKERTR